MTNHITFPKKSAELAEECGIHYGDGYMKIKRNAFGVHYEYQYTAHAYDDADYTPYVKKLMHKLYGMNPGYEKKKNNGFFMGYYSKELLDFKMKLGVPLSPKRNMIIPYWICKKREFFIHFLRGIYDTDGTLTYKKGYKILHKYPTISLGLNDKLLIDKIGRLLNILKIPFSKYLDIKKPREGYTKISKLWTLDITGRNNTQKFITTIGFKNNKHITKYKIWKKYGFCPAYTTLEERKKILSGEIPVLKFYDMPEGRFEFDKKI